MMARRSALAAVLLALFARTAWPCGACVEDQVAATYDHAVVQRAAAKGHVVVFCRLQGAVDVQRIKAAARGVSGLAVASVRVSAQPPAISFALDTARQSPQAAAAALQQALPGMRLTVIRQLDAARTAALPATALDTRRPAP